MNSEVSLIDDGSDVEVPEAAPSDVVSLRQQTIARATMPNPDMPAERAAQAIKLARVTGMKPDLVAVDVDHYASQAKAKATSEIFANNKYLREYVRQKPMAVDLSQNDWHNLDDITQEAEGIYEHPALRAFRQQGGPIGVLQSALIKGTIMAGEGAIHGAGPDLTTKTLSELHINPSTPLKDLSTSLAVQAAVATPFVAASSLMGAGMGGIIGFAQGAGEAVYESFFPGDAQASRFGRGLASLMEWKLQDVASHGGPRPEAAQIAKTWWNSANTQHFLRTGEPMWYDPTIEKLQIQLNEHHIDTMEKVIKAVEKSDTWKQDPVHVRDLLKTVHDGNIEINGEAVLKLYGDKAPVPGDGLLGDFPDIENQLNQVRLVGGDVSIPFADFTTAPKAKELFESFKDHIRVTPTEITKGEIEAKEAQREVHEAKADAQEEALAPAEVPEPVVEEPNPLEAPKNELEATAEPVAPTPEPMTPSALDVAKRTVKTAQKQHQRLTKKLQEATALHGEASPEAAAIQSLLDAQTQRVAEAKAAAKDARPPKPEREVIDDPIVKTRDAAGFEPLFSIGDRKLKIEKRPVEVKGDAFGADQWRLLDEHGQKVGHLEITPHGQNLYVDNVLGLGRFGARDFGPALMRDLLRQIKEAYPNATKIGGFRVSGAREKAGTEKEVWINLDNPKGWETIETYNEFRRILDGADGGKWETFSPRMEAYIRPREGRSAEDRAMIEAVMDEMDRIIPKQVSIQEADRIKASSSAGNKRPVEPSGAFIEYREAYPTILWALEGIDPIGTTHHEAIHHLRRYGFFEAGEWSILERAARDEGWIEKFGIERRYPDADTSLKLEEAIADGFKTWMREPQAVPEKLHPIFQKLKDLFDSIKSAIAKVIGKEPTWEDIFEKVDKGEVGNREGNAPINREAFTERLSAPEREPHAIGPTEGLFATPGTIGLNEKTARRLQARLREVQERDIEYRKSQAEDIKEYMTDEWKHERKLLRAEIETAIRQRPDVAIDLVLARGNYYGQPLSEKPKIAYDDLTAEQRKGVPKEYLTKPGVPSEYSLDDLASLVGFPTGERMIAGLIEYNRAKLEGNMTANAFINRMADIEADRVMAERGDLDSEISDRLKDHITSGGQLELMAEETMILAELAKLESPIKKYDLRDAVTERFGELPLKAAKSSRFLRESGKLETAIKAEMARENWVEALRLQQQREGQAIQAKEAVALEKEQKQFAKTVKKLAARNVKGLDQEYQDWIQTLLQKAGITTRRHPLEIQRSQALTGERTFPEFVTESMGDGWNLDVSPSIIAGEIKPISEMTVNEFREFKNAIDSLNNAGRHVEMNTAQGKKETFAEFKTRAMTNITSLPMRSRDSLKEDSIASRLYGFDSELTRMEVVMKALDLGEDMGPLVDMTIRPLAESKHKEYTMEEALSRDIKAINMSKGWRKGLNKKLPNDWFMDPRDPSGQTPLEITRSGLINIMLNWGNKSNQRKFVESWGSERPGKRASPEAAAKFKAKMEAYIAKHATPEDIKFVHGVWDIYKGYRHELDVLWRNTAGTQPRFVEPVRTELAEGKVLEGGYYPLLRDQTLSGKPAAKTMADSLFGPDYPNFATPQGHMKDRTAAAYYVNFDAPLKNIPQRMQQVIHDIAFRQEVMQVKQVLKDKEIRYAIHNHYGPEYVKQLDPWLKRTANGATLDETALDRRDKVARFFRMNLVKFALPLNPSVMFTPDVGLGYQILNYWGPGRAEKQAIANEWSKEIPHAIYNIDRDFREAMAKAVGEGKYDSMMNKGVRFGFGFVSYLSREFRTATFTKYFNEGLAKGLSKADAAAIADTYVREQHGSAALHDLPAIMAGGEMGRLMTMFYGYFNMQYNWARTIKGNINREEYMKAAQATLGTMVIGTMFGAWIANSAKEDDTFLERIARAIPMQALAMIPFVREAATYAYEGYSPRTPLGSAITSAGALITDTKKMMSGEAPEKPIQHAFAALGLLGGVPATLQLGRTSQGIADYSTGKHVPQSYMEWQRMILTGEMNLKSGKSKILPPFF